VARLGATDAAGGVGRLEAIRPTPAISGGPRKARLPVSGRMPPTRKVSALVWPDEHLSLVYVSVAGALDSWVAEGDSSAAAPPPESLLPQAARPKLRTAVPAITRAHVAVLDRFTS